MLFFRNNIFWHWGTSTFGLGKARFILFGCILGVYGDMLSVVLSTDVMMARCGETESSLVSEVQLLDAVS